MKYSDGFFQDLRRISPMQPVRSRDAVKTLIKKYGLEMECINLDFLIGFQTAVTIIGEKLREVTE